MAFNSLLTFVGAPHLNAVLDEPFKYKGCFTLNASQPVKHTANALAKPFTTSNDNSLNSVSEMYHKQQ